MAERWNREKKRKRYDRRPTTPLPAENSETNSDRGAAALSTLKRDFEIIEFHAYLVVGHIVWAINYLIYFYLDV